MQSAYLSPSYHTVSPYNYNYSATEQTLDYRSNQYYSSKIYDDHRFERRKLEKPGFLIRQENIYPQTNSYRIGSALDYADSLVKPPNRKFYSEAAEQQRLRVQGENPFYQTNPYNVIGKQSYLKRSQRSRINTNPNLGVTSYEVLNETLLQSSKRQGRAQQIGSFKQTSSSDVQDYIAKSILENSIKSPGKSSRIPPYQIIKQEDGSQQDTVYGKRQTFKPGNTVRKSTTIVKYKENPEQIAYKGKKFVKILI